MNISAGYCTGYLMDAPMDFSGWFEAFWAANGMF
jgi:hypothetical protein